MVLVYHGLAVGPVKVSFHFKRVSVNIVWFIRVPQIGILLFWHMSLILSDHSKIFCSVALAVPGHTCRFEIGNVTGFMVVLPNIGLSHLLVYILLEHRLHLTYILNFEFWFHFAGS